MLSRVELMICLTCRNFKISTHAPLAAALLEACGSNWPEDQTIAEVDGLVGPQSCKLSGLRNNIKSRELSSKMSHWPPNLSRGTLLHQRVMPHQLHVLDASRGVTQRILNIE